MAKSSAKTAKPIKTVTELAGLVGRDASQISRWTKRDDWPFARKSPWPKADVPKILNWIADTLERGRPAKEKQGETGGTTELRKQKLQQEIRKLRAQADQAETALARERGNLHDADECERQRVSDALKVANAVQLLPSQLLPLALSQGMPHEASATFQEQATELCTAVLRQLSHDGSTAIEDGES